MRQPKINLNQQSEYDKEIIDITRVARTVAGGRRFSFRAAVVIGNKQGKIGLGVAKGKDVAQSINKATKKAEKGMIEVVRSDQTIPIDIIGHFKSARVLLKPAAKGRGLIAGGVVRSLCALAGIENISAKILSKTNNKINIARASIEAFKKISVFQAKMNQMKSKDKKTDKSVDKKEKKVVKTKTKKD